MIRAALAALAFSGFVTVAHANKQHRGDVPVIVGGQPGLACEMGGKVVGLDPSGDNFLSVRNGPGGRGFDEIDRIYTGQRVAICDVQTPWLGVVYTRGADVGSCGLMKDFSVRVIYTGPCKVGWIHSRYVQSFADHPAE